MRPPDAPLCVQAPVLLDLPDEILLSVLAACDVTTKLVSDNIWQACKPAAGRALSACLTFAVCSL